MIIESSEIMRNIIVANLIALFSFLFNITSTQKNKKGQILLYNGVANVMSCIQFIILGAWTGAISCILAATRNVVFSLFKNKIPLIIFILYVIVVIVLNIPAITSIISIIPVIAIILYGYGLYQNNVGVLKIITVVVNISCLIYDIYNYAFVLAISDSIASISAIIGLIRYCHILKLNNLKIKAKEI